MTAPARMVAMRTWAYPVHWTEGDLTLSQLRLGDRRGALDDERGTLVVLGGKESTAPALNFTSA